MVSIHPCRHAETMKRMIDRLQESHDEKYDGVADAPKFGVPTDTALFLFLKVCHE